MHVACQKLRFQRLQIEKTTLCSFHNLRPFWTQRPYMKPPCCMFSVFRLREGNWNGHVGRDRQLQFKTGLEQRRSLANTTRQCIAQFHKI